MYKKMSIDLLSFIQKCPTAFHTVNTIKNLLNDLGFSELKEYETWNLIPGKDYYIIRGYSSLIAFRLPEEDLFNFQIAAVHSDSPALKIKPSHSLTSNNYVKLNTEKYGGMIYSAWLDRALSIAGKVAIKTENGAEIRLVNIDRDIAIIPSVPIHLNKNAEAKLSPQIELPILCSSPQNGSYDLKELIAEQLDTDIKDILSAELYAYIRQGGSIVGAKEEYISSPRLDDLQCAYAVLRGFMAASNPLSASVYAIFDNEETGSASSNGADSTFLVDSLARISQSYSKNSEEHRAAIASSFIISADNAHALHPNHPEFYDANNAPLMNEGVVIKYNANKRYTTDALSEAIFKSICSRCEVLVQHYSNHSDIIGGSTLGAISQTQLSIPSIDVGLAQLAMHSALETAGIKDTMYLAKAMSEYYSCTIKLTDSGFEIERYF